MGTAITTHEPPPLLHPVNCTVSSRPGHPLAQGYRLSLPGSVAGFFFWSDWLKLKTPVELDLVRDIAQYVGVVVPFFIPVLVLELIDPAEASAGRSVPSLSA
jgi:hypothetical protein